MPTSRAQRSNHAYHNAAPHGENISVPQGGCIKPILRNTFTLTHLGKVLIGPSHVIRDVLRHTGDRLACGAVLEDPQSCSRTGRCMAPVCAHKAPCSCKGRGERRSTCAYIWAAAGSLCCLQISNLVSMQVCRLPGCSCPVVTSAACRWQSCNPALAQDCGIAVVLVTPFHTGRCSLAETCFCARLQAIITLHCHSALLGPGPTLDISLWAERYKLYEVLGILQQAPVCPRQNQVGGINSLQKLQ